MQTIDFGMPTLIELDDITDCVSVCKGLGLNFIEINMNMPQYQADRLDIPALKSALENGIYFTFHLDENLNISDFNKKVAGAYLNTALETIHIANELRSPVINMHMAEGVHFKLPDKKVWLFDRYNDLYMDSIRNFREICEKEAGSDLKICIENCGGFLPFQKDAVRYLLESDAFGLTYDIGHDYCADSLDLSFIMENSDKLRHMHIHDAEADRCHLCLGTGKINIAEKLALARDKNCRCVIETKSLAGLMESVKYIDTWRNHNVNH